MTKDKFPLIASVLGCFLILVVFKGSELRDDGTTLLPLLTLLLVSEFGAIVSAAGVYFGGRDFMQTRRLSMITVASIGCGFLCVLFIVRGFQLWPH